VIERRAFIGTLAGGLLTAPLAAEAQPPRTVYRIGVLEMVDAASNSANLAAFRQGLAAFGYVDRAHYTIEYRSADHRTERLPDLAADLVRLKVDVIVTSGSPAALVAKEATGTIPIVMASSGNPLRDGIVANLDRPLGNVIGLHTMAPAELGSRRLQLLKQATPASSRVGILWNPLADHPALLVKDTEKAAGAMRVQLASLRVRTPGAFEPAFETALMDQVDALIVVEDYLTFTERGRIVAFAAMSRLPAIYGFREFVDAGGLMSYGTDRRDLYRRCATYVHKVLSGTPPAALPVEQPTKFELVINLKTAKALGLTIPQSLLQRADQVIE
jgi:putative ABC transport system substrate-binding protein